MTVENVLNRYRNMAAILLAQNKGIDKVVANAYLEVVEAVEEDIRQSNRVHQDKT